jgi:hypothetical protein
MTVARLVNEMSHREWLAWAMYYGIQAQRQDLAQQRQTRGR